MSYEHGGTMRFDDGTGAHKVHKRGADADLDYVEAHNVGDPKFNEDAWVAFLTICAKNSSG
jgi:hypothetical protein